MPDQNIGILRHRRDLSTSIDMRTFACWSLSIDYHASLKSLCHAHCCLFELKNDFLILLWLVGGVLLGAGYSFESGRLNV